MYEQTVNELVAMLRAKAPLINLVLDCERVCDVRVPNLLSQHGAEIASRAVGPATVCFSWDATGEIRQLVGGNTKIRRFSAAGMRVIDDFMADVAGNDSNLEDIVAAGINPDDNSPEPPLASKLYSDLVKAEKGKAVRVLFMVYDVPLDGRGGLDQVTRRHLLKYAKQNDTATVMLMTTEPVDDAMLRTYMPILEAKRPSRDELTFMTRTVFVEMCTELGMPFARESTNNGMEYTCDKRVHLRLPKSDDDVGVDAVSAQVASSLSGLHVPTALFLLRSHLESHDCMIVSKSPKSITFNVNPEALSRAKAEILNKEGYVALINDKVDPSEIGGLSELKRWLSKRRDGFGDEAEGKHMRNPKGMMMVGPPGTAKSMCAKMAGTILGMPIIRLDVGALFNSRLGNSERNVRNALQVADASSPCVLWLDEVASRPRNLTVCANI